MCALGLSVASGEKVYLNFNCGACRMVSSRARFPRFPCQVDVDGKEGRTVEFDMANLVRGCTCTVRRLIVEHSSM